MTSTDSLLPHLIALHFIKREVMNAQLLISKEFLPPGTGSLSSGSETHFLPSLINFLLLLWQAPLHVSFGSASFSSSGKCWPFPSLSPYCNLLFISEPLWDYCIDLFLCFSLSAWIPSTQMCPAHLLSLLLAQGQVAFQKCGYQFNLPLLGHEKAGIIF